ncbi:MAG: 50S ribosomal protein L1 [Cenarchaeum sp. SB0663_bin_5]|nr:50S ribosomal protein L1 [Cenarchaeum sp. SB0663_bin_5]MYH04059.1 50S ribosomal protein L1 [Cenarchaeum sp. SB0675_bin_21]MYL12092.1 50S ribosomal protein L1 [Cenarchaeum sp. SB0669_bin_11]
MITESQMQGMIQEAKESSKGRNFVESVEIIVVFKDIDVKKGFQINEVVQLPQIGSDAAVCVLAGGDMGTKAREANATAVVDADELGRLSTDKRAARKFINKYDFFLADTQIMPTVGKSLGQLLGPRGKMPTPVPFNAPIEAFLQRFKKSIRVRVRGSLSISSKIGNQSMDDASLAANAMVVLRTIEKKLPNGEKNIRDVMIKTTMGKIIKGAKHNA